MFHTHIINKELKAKLCRCLSRHPLGAFMLLFTGLPLSVLAAVTFFAVLFVYPVSFLMGLI